MNLEIVRSLEPIETRSFILANSASLGAAIANMVLPWPSWSSYYALYSCKLLQFDVRNHELQDIASTPCRVPKPIETIPAGVCSPMEEEIVD